MMNVILQTRTAKGKRASYPEPFANKLIKMGLAKKEVIKAEEKSASKKTKKAE